jgi:hypothetical protein
MPSDHRSVSRAAVDSTASEIELVQEQRYRRTSTGQILHPQNCDTPVSPRVSLKKPNQEPLFHVNQSKHEHQINLSNKEFTKYILKSVMIKTIETFER